LSLKTKDNGFSGLGLKTGTSALQICVLKSSQRFLRLGLKTKPASVCWLLQKIDGSRLARDTRQDVAVCFVWMHVGLGFFSLALRLVEAWLRVVHVASSQKSRGVEAEDGPVDATGYIRLFYHKIVVFIVLVARGNLIF
jgi:hypothetical protein